jgi:hypothetical protein
VRYDSCQFGSFDGLDNRKALMAMIGRLGHGQPEALAARTRAAFLRSLIPESVNGFAPRPLIVSPCTVVECYHLLVAITGVLGVPIDVAARKLEAEVRRQC